jgi:hypothetical protein
MPPAPTILAGSPADSDQTSVSSSDTYRLGIHTLYDSNSNAVISNGTQEHAALLFELFFRKATDRVVIFCEKLSKAVFDKSFVVDAASQALSSGRRISIITQLPPESERFNDLTKQFSNLEIVTATNPFVKSLEVNFAVVDHRAFRFEPKRGDCKAQASMFDVPGAVRLLDTFQRLKSLAMAADTTGAAPAATPASA